MSLFDFWKNSRVNNKKAKARRDKSSIGNILIDMGLVTEKVLDEAVQLQKDSQMLGQILIQMKVITEVNLKEALLEQKIRRKKASLGEIHKTYSKKRRQILKEVNGGFEKVVQQTNKLILELEKK